MMRQQQLSAAGKVVEIGATQRFLRIAPGAIPGRGGGQDAIRILPGSSFHWLPAGPNFSALSKLVLSKKQFVVGTRVLRPASSLAIRSKSIVAQKLIGLGCQQL